jgi:hypothetical protein
MAKKVVYSLGAWGHWFAGFTDAEGCFTVSVQRNSLGEATSTSPEFSICLRKDDEGIIKKIIKVFDFSSKIQYARAYGSTRPTVRFRVRGARNCRKLADVFLHYSLRTKKKKDFEIWLEIVDLCLNLPKRNRWIGSSDKSDILRRIKELKEVKAFRSDRKGYGIISSDYGNFSNWFAGFTDGEGSFGFVMNRTKEGKVRHIRPRLSIGLRDDDGETLREIDRFYGLDASLVIKKNGKNPLLNLEIKGISRCLKIIEIFNKYPLRAKKMTDFQKWKSIIAELQRLPAGNRHCGPSDKTRILKLIDQFRRGREYEV